MLQEDGVVRSATQVADRDIRLALGCGGTFRTADVLCGSPLSIRSRLTGLSPIVIEHAALGPGDDLRYFPKKLLQRGHRRRAEFRTSDRYIHVEVGDRVG